MTSHSPNLVPYPTLWSLLGYRRHQNLACAFSSLTPYSFAACKTDIALSSLLRLLFSSLSSVYSASRTWILCSRFSQDLSFRTHRSFTLKSLPSHRELVVTT